MKRKTTTHVFHIMNNKVEQLIKEAIPDAQVDFQDFKNDGLHFFLGVTSETFNGKPIVHQHRSVMKAIQPLLDSGELHAVKIKTSTP